MRRRSKIQKLREWAAETTCHVVFSAHRWVSDLALIYLSLGLPIFGFDLVSRIFFTVAVALAWWVVISQFMLWLGSATSQGYISYPYESEQKRDWMPNAILARLILIRIIRKPRWYLWWVDVGTEEAGGHRS